MGRFFVFSPVLGGRGRWAAAEFRPLASQGPTSQRGEMRVSRKWRLESVRQTGYLEDRILARRFS
jgi:hypothetical protein